MYRCDRGAERVRDREIDTYLFVKWNKQIKLGRLNKTWHKSVKQISETKTWPSMCQKIKSEWPIEIMAYLKSLNIYFWLSFTLIHHKPLKRTFKTGFWVKMTLWICVLVLWIHKGYSVVKSFLVYKTSSFSYLYFNIVKINFLTFYNICTV